MVMTFIFAFIVGGIICVIGQLLMDVGNLTPAHTLSTLVVAHIHHLTGLAQRSREISRQYEAIVHGHIA